MNAATKTNVLPAKSSVSLRELELECLNSLSELRGFMHRAGTRIEQIYDASCEASLTVTGEVSNSPK